MAPAPAQPLVFAIRGPLARADLPGLSARVCELLAGRSGEVVVCDAAGVGADAVTVDALARLQLAAGRHRCRVHVRNASAELLDLLRYLGLADAIPEGAASPGDEFRLRPRSNGRTARTRREETPCPRSPASSS